MTFTHQIEQTERGFFVIETCTKYTDRFGPYPTVQPFDGPYTT